jgi:glycosyltransferase involved in cell wall biosynthesis
MSSQSRFSSGSASGDVDALSAPPEPPTGAGRRVRVGYVLTAISEGGLERFTLELGRRLPKDRFEPIVYSLTPHAPWGHRFQQEGIPVRTYRARNRPESGSWWPNLRTIFELARDLRRDGVEIVHTCDFYPATIGRLSAFLARIPGRVHTLHSLYDWYPQWAHRINRLLASKTQQIIAVSNPVLESSVKLDKLPSDRYQLVHNGVDPTLFYPVPSARGELRSRLGLPDSARIIATVGAYTVRKGHRTVAQAVIPLLKEDPDLHLALFGTRPEPEFDITAELREAFGRAGFADRLHMPGPVEDVRTVYCGSDIFCMASQVEGLSLASIEAQMCGCLCIFSDIPSFREVAQEGVNGFLFPVGEADSLRRALRFVLTLSPERAAAIRNAARSMAEARFPISQTVEGYRRIYEEVLGSVR